MIFFDWRFWIKTILGLALFIGALIVTSDSPASNKEIWQAYAAKMEAKHNLPTGLLAAICEQETHWRNVLGAHGEIGVCQVQVNTVRMVCPHCDGNTQDKLFYLGMRGDAVKRIQMWLSRDGYYTGAVDGVFGPLTQEAVTLYQQTNKLSMDGVVGPKTWRTLTTEAYPGSSIAAVLWNPEDNIEWAAKYLAWLRANVSPEPLIMMAAYNGGPANQTVKYMVSVNRKRGDI